jgi:membrane protein DedA with SNARE-associated domain
MGGTIEFPVKYGYIVVFVGVFAEQIGLPFPSAPMLMAAGALVGFRRLNVFEALTLAARAKRANLLFQRSGEPTQRGDWLEARADSGMP